MGLISALPNFQSLIGANAISGIIYKVIDRVPEIADTAESASVKFNLRREIIFEDVTFKYPTAPEEARAALSQVNFRIQAGKTTAIVGASGCGKSTVVQLI